MKIDRRDLFRIGATQLMLYAVPEKSQACVPELKTRPSILQGATDETKTQFSILYDTSAELNIYIHDSKGKVWYADKFELITHKNHSKKITKFYVSGLHPDEIFQLFVINTNSNIIIDNREFKMLNSSKENIQFALCSCMDDRYHEASIWQNVIAKNPDLIFFLGDFVYADRGIKGPATPDHLWKRFTEVRQTLEIFFSKRLIPILATWDDHDFGLNDSHSKNYPYIRESQKNFLDFFAQDESFCDFLEQGPGVSSALKWNSQLFLLLDDRSFRQAQNSQDRYAHWGAQQEDWLINVIQNNSGPTWFMNGSQIFPEMFLKESVSGNHPVQFKGLVERLKKLDSRIIFASGDVHYSEISQIEPDILGYETYEITSSSIHSKSTPGSPHIIKNNRRIAGTGARNFVMVESCVLDNGADMKVTSYNASGKVLFTKELKVPADLKSAGTFS